MQVLETGGVVAIESVAADAQGVVRHTLVLRINKAMAHRGQFVEQASVFRETTFLGHPEVQAGEGFRRDCGQFWSCGLAV